MPGEIGKGYVQRRPAERANHLHSNGLRSERLPQTTAYLHSITTVRGLHTYRDLQTADCTCMCKIVQMFCIRTSQQFLRGRETVAYTLHYLGIVYREYTYEGASTCQAYSIL